MEENISTAQFILVVISVFVIYNLINYVGTRSLVKWLYERYRKEVASLESDDKIHDVFKEKSHLSEERAILEIISKRRSHKFDLSIVISNIEFILISGATFLVINHSGLVFEYDALSKIGIVVLSWFGIKVLGYHGHWQQPIFGRSIFSVFLLGSIINISLAFFAGWLLAAIA